MILVFAIECIFGILEWYEIGDSMNSLWELHASGVIGLRDKGDCHEYL